MRAMATNADAFSQCQRFVQKDRINYGAADADMPKTRTTMLAGPVEKARK
jgi:hypothetical protein